MAAALHQGVNPWFPAKPDYWNFINIWDARWYGEALRNGYPAELPTDDAGNVQENAWAFYPLFPLLGRTPRRADRDRPRRLADHHRHALRAGGGPGGLPALPAQGHPPHGALGRGVLLPPSPSRPVLQVPYAESLNLLLLAAALLLVVRRHYLWAMPVVLLMCLSRPTGVPFAAMAGLLFLYRVYPHLVGAVPRPARWRVARPTRPPNGPPARAAQPRRAVVPGRAGRRQRPSARCCGPPSPGPSPGDIQAYTKTETVWRGHDLVPFKPWFDTGIQLFGPVLGLLAPFVFVAALRPADDVPPPVAALGAELRLWCVCYVGYLLVFLHPQTSTFRMLLPLFPLALSAALVSRSRAYRGTVVVMFLLLQIVWIVWLWAWAQLPGGGDYPP